MQQKIKPIRRLGRVRHTGPSLYSGVSTAFRTIVGFVAQSTRLRHATAPRSPVSATTVVITLS